MHQPAPLRACIARPPHYTLPNFFTAPGECRMTIYQQPPAPIPAPMPAPAPRSNGLGIAAFIVSLLGFITCGILWPVGLFLSFIALFRRPRGFAFAGFIISLVGTAILGVVIAFFGVVIFSLTGLARLGAPGIQMIIAMVETQQAIENHHRANGTLPDDLTGEAIANRKTDGWGHPLHYRQAGPGRYELRTDGADGVPGTGDDASQEFTLSSGPEKP